MFTEDDGNESDISKMDGPDYPHIYNLTIYVKGVLKRVKELKIKKAACPDDLPA